MNVDFIEFLLYICVFIIIIVFINSICTKQQIIIGGSMGCIIGGSMGGIVGGFMKSENNDILFWENDNLINLSNYRQYIIKNNKKTNIELEIARNNSLKKLQNIYKDLCKKYLSWNNPPSGSFHRWIFERQTTAAINNIITDPILPPYINIKAESMYREIVEDLPAKIKPSLQFISKTDELNKYIATYNKNANILINKYKNHKDTIQLKQELKKLKKNINKKQIIDIKKRCDMLFENIVKKNVELICESMNNAAKKEIELLKNIIIKEHIIDKNKNNDKIILKLDNYVLHINEEHFNKIKNNFQIESTNFDLCVWNMLFRYKSYFGDRDEGEGHHAAVPIPVMKKLNQLFNVNYECFASPLNHYFPNFNSAFGDVDCYFGSLGSFFSTQFAAGFYEANPPFIEELMNAMASHMLKCLEKSEKNNLSLCFIIIVPYWNNPPVSGMVELRKSNFCKKTHILKAQKHTFLSGLQHKEEKNKITFKAVHDTELLFMQTSKANQICPITLEKIKEIEDVWSNTY